MTHRPFHAERDDAQSALTVCRSSAVPDVLDTCGCWSETEGMAWPRRPFSKVPKAVVVVGRIVSSHRNAMPLNTRRPQAAAESSGYLHELAKLPSRRPASTLLYAFFVFRCDYRTLPLVDSLPTRDRLGTCTGDSLPTRKAALRSAAMSASEDSESLHDFRATIDQVILHIIRITIMYLTSAAVWIFARRFFRRQHYLTTLGVIGSIIYLVAYPILRSIELVGGVYQHICHSSVNVVFNRVFVSTSSFIMLLHLLLKARVVRNLGLRPSWSWLQITALISLLLVPASAIWLGLNEFRVWLYFNPASHDLSGRCGIYVFNIHVAVYGATLVVNNIMCCVMFLDGLFTLVTGGVETASPLRRFKAMIILIFLGRRGVKYLPKDRIIITTALIPTQSFSSHLSVQEQRDAKIDLARRSFFCMLANALITTTIMIFMRFHWFGFCAGCFLSIEPAASWFLTALACPTPVEQPRSEPLNTAKTNGTSDRATTSDVGQAI